MKPIIIPAKLTVKQLTYTDIKIAGYLFTLWKSGKYSSHVLPTSEEISKETGIPLITVKRSVAKLATITFYDETDGEYYPILITEGYVNKATGKRGRIYQIYIPGYGICRDPAEFTERRGGASATWGAIGGYFTITPEIQSLNLKLSEEICLSALAGLIKTNRNSKWVYHASSLTKAGILKGREKSISISLTSLRKRGYLIADDNDGFYKGYKNVVIECLGYEYAEETPETPYVHNFPIQESAKALSQREIIEMEKEETRRKRLQSVGGIYV